MSTPERREFVPAGGPPAVERPDPGIYAQMGQGRITAMILEFYEELERSPIRPMFPENMPEAGAKTALYFVQILGGPPLFEQRFGPPRLRQRHLRFPITEEARRVWLDCFHRVLDRATERHGFPAEHLPGFRAFLDAFSAWMVNTAG